MTLTPTPLRGPHACPVCRCGMWRPDIHPTRWDEVVSNNQRLAGEVRRLKAENFQLLKRARKR